ncbi:hypothetical protein EV126DRAFT_494923 [Verticillium dahliae]|nr:putative membrane protein [Verticillium dahliae VDG2]KAH6702413.1 hypothetical protein EV126DRAFT_494923 [Verticillium dahliae]
MTRRKFRADVAAAINISIPGISSVGLGPDDGEVVCIYTSNRSAVQIPLRLTTASVDDYPQHQGFHGSTECDEIPSSIMGVLGRLVYSTQGRSVIDSLAILSNQLETALGSAATEQQSEDHVSVADATDSSPEDEIGGDTDVEFEDYDLEIHDNTTSGIDLHPIAAGSQNQVKRNVRLREDLAKAREVGFGIGLWPNDDIVSLSLRASKLGLSTETLTAWDIEPTEYIVLLFKYEDHYLPLETFATIQGKEKPMLFRVGQCTTYKPSLVTAQAAFNKQDQAASTLEDASDGNGDFDRLYMSNSLDLWMEQEFAALLLLRIQSNLSWDNAKLAMLAHSKSDHLRGPTSAPEAVTADQEAEVLISPTAPYKLNQDYLIRNPESDSSGLLQISNLSNAKQERSLPLVAMQFALRYLVNCTKYCMVCHLKTSDAFAAITPYVCDNPLCLYQYMSLGFGPSIEHEIISQPLVVDLLISCFMISLQQNKLREFPDGLNLLLPSPIFSRALDEDFNQCIVNFSRRRLFRTRKDRTTSEVVSSLRLGDVFLLARVGTLSLDAVFVIYHCVVVSFDYVENAITFECLATIPSTSSSHISGASTKDDLTIHYDCKEDYFIHPFEHELSELNPHQRAQSLALITASLPAVPTMRQHLMHKPNAAIEDCPGMGKPSLALLRWIITSNRSMIVQIDSADNIATDSISSGACEKLSGISTRCVQFRFAQGSPDKEQRLIEAVRANSLTKAAPTIFAWHGSSLGNWHSIIRQGLDFSRVVNGRAFGHGVYFSPHWETSSSYAAQPAQTDTYGWFRSQLQPSSVISLCEIVNRPDAFVSNNPHYVVADVDWIQCRYLIVQSAMAPAMRPQDDIELVPVTPGTAYLKQDPKYRVYGPWTRMLEVSGAGPPVGIPETASSGARLSQQLTSPVENVVLEDVETGDPSVEDCDFEKCVRDIGPEIGGPEATSTTAVILNSRKTDFRPGTLDIKSLPKLPAPTWAMDSGRRALGHELKKLQKVQATTPLHELGWYIDFNSIENLFHWIVELHSFDPRLHLAQDMKSAGARSIVLELRFGRSYPLTPPFVRVIRPRFLPFMAGGGGHVTNGGAMCMELLTNSGWSPATSLENVLVQVRMAMSGEDPQPARLEDPVRYRTRVTDYGIDEAIVAFRRSALAHGWAIPSDLEETARLA